MGFSTEWSGTYFKVFFDNPIAPVLVFRYITHKICKHKATIVLPVCVFTFCQYSHYS